MSEVAETVAELGMREVLHWLIDRVAPRPITEVTSVPAPAADVRAAVDRAFHYVAPDEAMSAAEAAQLNDLLAKQARIAEAQREADAAAAEQAAGVEHFGLPGS